MDEKPPRRGQFIRRKRPRGGTRHTGSAPPAGRKLKPGVFRRRAGRGSETGVRATAFRGHQNALILLVDRMRYCRMQPRLSRSEEHTSELQSRQYLVCRLLLEKKNR